MDGGKHVIHPGGQAASTKTGRGSVSTSSKMGATANKGPFQKSKSKEVPSVKSSIKATISGQDLLGKFKSMLFLLNLNPSYLMGYKE